MQSERSKRLVFVCVENCNRSQMAEAFARMYGAGELRHTVLAASPPNVSTRRPSPPCRNLATICVGTCQKGFQTCRTFSSTWS